MQEDAEISTVLDYVYALHIVICFNSSRLIGRNASDETTCRCNTARQPLLCVAWLGFVDACGKRQRITCLALQEYLYLEAVARTIA